MTHYLKGWSHKFLPENIPLWPLLPALVVALLLNHYKLPFFAGSHLIFGNIIAVVVLFYYGLFPALTISILAGVVTYFDWGNAINLMPNAVELLVLNFAIKRRFNPVVLGMIYWASLGWIIVAINLYLFTNFALITNYAITIKYFVNGILNLLFGLLLVRAIAGYFKVRVYGSVSSFAHSLTNHIFYIVSITLISVSLIGLKVVQERELTSFNQRLQVRSDNLVTSIESYIERHMQGLQLASISHQDISDPKQLTSLLSNLKTTYPSILTLLATDEQGKILASAPSNLMDKAQQTGAIYVADRPYFYKVKKSLSPFISQVFRGRGFGSDYILALSVPIATSDNSFKGILEASLDLNLISSLDIKVVAPSEGIILLDQYNQVIYASPELNYYFMENITDSELLKYLETPENYFVVDQKLNSLIAVNGHSEQLGWRVISSIPRELYEGLITSYMVFLLTLLALLILFSVIMSRWLAGRVTSPLQKLSTRLEAASHPEELYQISSNEQHSGILEIITAQEKLKAFAERSKQLVADLRQANIDKESVNKELQALNDNLEQMVSDKTRKLKSALKEAQIASQAKTEFLANVSHEIRTPITGVLGMLEALEQSPLDKEQKELIKLAEFSANNLLNLINDILNFSKIEAGKLDFERLDFDLHQLVDDIIGVHKYTIKDKSIELEADYTETKARYRIGDPLRVSQVFNNLISNAIKFTHQGRIRIELKDIKVDNKLILHVDVIDTGIGISNEAQSKLFDAFEQADSSTTRKFGGTGLGLSISKQLCEHMNGSMSVTSILGEGSTFSFYIELPESNEASLEVIKDQSIALEHVQQGVLLVEDNPVNQKVIEKILTKKGLKVDLADNGLKGLAYLAENPNSYFMVLMDCQMPEMDGFTATQKIRAGDAGESNKDIPIVAITANAFDSDIDKCLTSGMNAYLSKPIDFTKLIQLINQYSKQS